MIADPLLAALLERYQRDLPITPRPYARMAQTLGVKEEAVLAGLRALEQTGALARVGATLRPNAAGASTLAALKAPPHKIEKLAGIVSCEAGVNHAYQREDAWNIWFVATGPDRAHVDATLTRIAALTRAPLIDAPLVRAFNVDLGFSLSAPRVMSAAIRPLDRAALTGADRPILHALTRGLSLTPRPYAELACAIDLSEEHMLVRIRALVEAGYISRLGVILRHRPLGFTSNAMIVWRLAPEHIDELGPILAAQPGVTLCYERRGTPDVWPFTLYCMIHARARSDALNVLSRIESLPGFRNVDHRILFSTRCFKQTGALVMAEPEARSVA